jgi:LacI family transcriptional regulator
MVASNLRSQQSDLLALLLPDITNSFWTSIARGVEDEAWTRGYGVFICNTDNNLAKEERYIERILRRRVEGVLIVPTPDPASELQLVRLRRQGVKFVVVHRRLENQNADVVRSDGGKAAWRMSEELVRRGCRRIAFVGISPADPTTQDRLAGFRSALRVAQVPIDEDLVRFGAAHTEIGGYGVVKELLKTVPPPDGILIANSRLALGGLRAIADRGLVIPRDVSVAAFHDINLMDPWASRLIRAVQPSYRMGQLATRRLLEIEATEDAGDHYQEIVLEPDIHLPDESV